MSEPAKPPADLVAKPQEDGKMFTGAGPLDGFEDIGGNIDNAFQEGKSVDPVQLGIDGAGAALDIAGAVTDPLGTLASSAVGWIIENVGFIREPFDKLMGDPPAVEAASNTFANIAQQLTYVGQQHKDSLSQITGWQEQSGQAYRGEAKNLGEHIANAAAGAESAANKIKIAGILVAATRALIRDLLAELAGTLIVWGLGALASAVPTAGASVAAFVTRAVTKAVEIAGKIAQFLKKLFRALDKLGGLAKGSSDALRQRADDLAATAASRADTGLDARLKMKEQHMADNLRQKADARDARDQKLDDFTDRTNQKADELRNKADGYDQKAREKWQENRQNAREGHDMSAAGYDRLTTRADATSDGPLSGTRLGNVASTVDGALGKSMTDGQNMIRGAMSGDIMGHLKPGWGDVIPGAKEGMKETNKAYGQEDSEKPFDEKDRK